MRLLDMDVATVVGLWRPAPLADETGGDCRPLIDRLTTRDFAYPSPGPSWLRTRSRRHRSGSRRIKHLTRRAARAGRYLPVYYRYGTRGWNTASPIYLIPPVSPLDAGLGPWVKAACGCVWHELRPEGTRLDPDEPRACGRHRADHPASLYPSPQGMAMVDVTYHQHDPS